MSSSGSGRDESPAPLPIWPSQRDQEVSGPPARARRSGATPPVPPPPPPGDYDPAVHGWPDPPGPLWPGYPPPPARRRRTLPLVLGGGAAVLLVTVGILIGLVLARPAAGPAGSAAASSSAPAPVGAASSNVAPNPSTSTGPASAAGPIVAGDCVFVASTTSTALDNARITRQRCDAADAFFAKVLARVATKANCPPDTTISRIQDGTEILCLGQGDRGTIAKAGDCVRVPTGFTLPLIRTDCAASSRPLQLLAIVDEGQACPSGVPGKHFSGYDRLLCVRYPDGN